jgi:hypothetical protein
MVMGPWWIGVGVLEVKEVDEPQALKPTRIKTNAPTIYEILLAEWNKITLWQSIFLFI